MGLPYKSSFSNLGGRGRLEDFILISSVRGFYCLELRSNSGLGNVDLNGFALQIVIFKFRGGVGGEFKRFDFNVRFFDAFCL